MFLQPRDVATGGPVNARARHRRGVGGGLEPAAEPQRRQHGQADGEKDDHRPRGESPNEKHECLSDYKRESGGPNARHGGVELVRRPDRGSRT
ncbi:hypothetical protein GCM10010411_35650 [Actinomadura fulvescens]|uniref:Uncharacterized protein n=1 Tax=Actinomadura fulvescens TaxID=46160 RepID=A0ABP6C2G3_9ACTN